MNTTRRVLQNSFLNLVAGVSQRIGQALIFILVARLMPGEAPGSLKLATTYTSVLLAFSFWGLDQLLIREVAKDTEQASRYLSGFATLRLMLALLLWLGLFLILPLLPYTPASKQLILVMTFTIIPDSITNIYHSLWIAFENVKAISVIMLFFSVVRLLGGVVLLWLGRPIVFIAYLFLAVALVEMFTNVWITHRCPDLVHFRRQIDFSFWIANLKAATPLIIVSFVLIIEYQFDVVILSLFRPEEEVGVYGTASTLLTFLLFLTRSYQLAIFPVISRAYHSSPSYLKSVYTRSFKFLLLGTVAIAIGVTLISEELITFVFGPEYQEAGYILSVLVWALVISGINVPNSRLLIVASQQRVMAYFALLSTTGNLALSLWLVPRFGGAGTAWARVLAMPLYTVPALIYVQYRICRIDWQTWRKERLFKRPL